MGTGWRRAFCTSIDRDRETIILEKKQQSSSPSHSSQASCTKFGFIISCGSNPSSPRLQSQTVATPSLRCQTTMANDDSPRIQYKTPSTATTPSTKSPRLLQASNTSSPRSPSRFLLFKNSLRLSRSSCGICLQSVKTGQGTAIFTAECSHTFHFPCIAAHVRKHGSLDCPVCSANRSEVPLLAIYKHHPPPPSEPEEQYKSNRPKNKKSEDTKRESPPRDVKTTQRSSPSGPSIYNDDEPLPSTTAGSRFNPIPEADENDDSEEFQGFFVNPTCPNSEAVKVRNLNKVQVTILPEAAVVSVGRSHETYVVALKVKAPPPPLAATSSSTTAPLLDPTRRAPIDLVTVLDVSSSMSGAKLQLLKRAMRLVMSSLGPADRLSIVAFSASPKRLLPLRRMTAHGQRLARLIIDRLICGHGTSTAAALRKAAKVLEDRRERNSIASIMLLSDCQNDRVPNNAASRSRFSENVQATRFAHLEIPVHASCFGENGGHIHIPVEDAFAKCVGALLSVVVRDLRLQLVVASGSAPAEISSVYTTSTGRPTVFAADSVRLGDLYAAEERELLVELRVPASVAGDRHVLSVRWCYKDPATQEMICCNEQPVLVPRPEAVRSTEGLRNLFVTIRAIAESRRLTEREELSSAHQLLSSARALLMQSSSISADEHLRSLETELAELHCRRQQQQQQEQMQRRRTSEREPAHAEPITPTSAWKAAERLAKLAIMRKSLNRASDLHGFENARF